MTKKTRKVVIIVVSCILAVFVLAGTGFGIYVSDYYSALPEAVALSEVSSDVKKEENYIAFGNENAKYGVIFYPGGKVQYEAYAPLMQQLKERGIFCVLLKVKVNLAILDVDAADGIMEKFPEIEEWYFAGHSLGGSVACMYTGKLLERNIQKVKGLILLASFSTVDFSNSDLKILSIYGTNDKVLGMESYEKNKVYYPEHFREYVIEGGNHAMFGTYGPQKGDGEGEITGEEQILISADEIWRFVNWK